jgi:cytochrome c biogenesis protein CcmG/thiol:disulfide interchange protein DsbE
MAQYTMQEVSIFMEVNRAIPNTAIKPENIDVASVPSRKHSRKRSITIFVVVSVLNVALLVLLWTQLLTPASNSKSTSGFGDTSGVGDANSPLIGKPMPNFTLSTLDGNTTVHLASFKGKPLLLNFWASWCVPCQQEAPFLQKAQFQLKAQGVILIGIDGQELASAAQSFLQKNNLSYLNVSDTRDGTTAISYGVTGNPETFFINQKGMVVARWIGALNAQGLKLELAKMR